MSDEKKKWKQALSLKTKINEVRIMSDFSWKDFKSGQYGVRCRTFEEAEAFLRECQMMGITWASGDCATAEIGFWRLRKEISVFIVDDGGLKYDSAAVLPEEKVMDYSSDMVVSEDRRKFWEGFEKSEIAVMCEDYEEMLKFYVICGEHGYRWNSRLRLEFEANWWLGKNESWCIGVDRKSSGRCIVPGKEKDFKGYKILDYIEYAFIAGEGEA